MTNRLDEATLRNRYEAGVQAHNLQKKQRVGETAALMLAVEAYDDAAEDRRFKLAAHVAKLVCIAAVFVIPNLLLIDIAFF